MFRYLILVVFIAQAAIGQESLKTVTAEPGDGILSLLRKQGVNPYEIFDEFVALNNHDLRDSVHLIAGKTYVIPKFELETVPIVDTIQKQSTDVKKLESASYAIFGEKHKNLVVTGDTAADASLRAEAVKHIKTFYFLEERGPDRRAALVVEHLRQVAGGSRPGDRPAGPLRSR